MGHQKPSLVQRHQDRLSDTDRARERDSKRDREREREDAKVTPTDTAGRRKQWMDERAVGGDAIIIWLALHFEIIVFHVTKFSSHWHLAKKYKLDTLTIKEP